MVPDIRVLGVTVRAPIGNSGDLEAPTVAVRTDAAVAQLAIDTVANRLWRSSTAEWLNQRAGMEPSANSCARQLLLARLGRQGDLPPPQPVLPMVPRKVQNVV